MIWGRLFQRQSRVPKVTIYSKSECPLCDELMEIIESIHGSVIQFELNVIKLEDDADAAELYKYEVPVVFIDGTKRFFGKVQKTSLVRSLRIAAKKKGGE